MINKMEVKLDTTDGKYSRFGADLDNRLGPSQWEKLYLEEGIRDPESGKEYEPHEIRNVTVRPIQSGSLTWLSQQVEEVCKVGATL